jgi:rhamnosyl/mannosyltransferase
MKVLHLFKTYFPDTQGGLEEAIRQIAKHSVKNGYEAKVVYVSKNPQKLIQEGIETESFKYSFGPASSPFSFSLVRNVRRLIDDCDIIHLYYPYPVVELAVLRTFTKKPIVLTYIGKVCNPKWFNMVYYPFHIALLKKAKVIVPINVNLTKSITVLHKFKEKVQPINLWIDEERANKERTISEKFKDFVKSNPDYALFVGVLRWYKGLDFLLNASKNVKGKILVVGKGPLMDHLKERIKNEKINNVTLLGFVPDDEMFYLMQNCRFFVLPSISPAEAFGQVLLEASYNSKPMISTELGTGTSFVNYDKETGFVVQPNDVEGLSIAMNTLFTNDELCVEYGKNAKKRLYKYFSEEVEGDKYIRIYEDVLNK